MGRGELWHKIETVQALFLDRAGRNVDLKVDKVSYHEFQIGTGVQLPVLDDVMGSDVTTRYIHFSFPKAKREFYVHFSIPEVDRGLNGTLEKVNPRGRAFYGEMLIVKISSGVLVDMDDCDVELAIQAAVFTSALVADDPDYCSRKTIVIHTSGLVAGSLS